MIDLAPDLFAAPVRKIAELSACGLYRYTLARVWNAAKPQAIFIMLNPSTADAARDDPTIRRCMAFARDWKMGGIIVLNLFALRATKPAALYAAADPFGPHNTLHVMKELDALDCTRAHVVCAWGTHGGYANRDREILALIRQAGIVPTCLGTTREGYPRHPLYVKGDTKLRPYEGRPA